MIVLEIKAPFAVFRQFVAGSFRSTAGFITPSAAYGLILNLAGIEMRIDDGKSAMTLINKELPVFRLALGIPVSPEQKPDLPTSQTLYQQLHNYPVGGSGKEKKELTKGGKYNIVPAWRSLLLDFHAYLVLDSQETLEQQVKAGLLGEIPRAYGLPFLGDNNFLPDVIAPLAEIPEAFWWERVREGGLRDNATRLTTFIDRADMSQTKADLFAPTLVPTTEIPESAWVEVGY